MKCHWCNKEATLKDYRTIDDMTSKIPSCEECAGLSDSYLVKRRYDKYVSSLEEEIAKYKKGYEIMADYFDSISDEEKPKVHKQLEKIGL